MPLKVLTRDNLEEVSKETGHSVEKLTNFLQQTAANHEAALVQVPMPKHLR